MKYLSVSAILRGERPYLREWLDFHINQGVEHFYLYDNSEPGEPDQKEIAEPFIEKGLVTWHVLPGLRKQRVAYNHTIDNYKLRSEWVAAIDVDEFLWSTKHKKFSDALKEYDKPGISGVAIHWLLFNGNGLQEYSPEPVVKRFTMRADSVNHHVKSVMRLRDTVCMGNDPHSFRHTGIVVDENFTEMPYDYAIISPATADNLRINHYVCKSYQEFMERKTLRPDANSGIFKNAQEMWDAHNVGNIKDESIFNRL